MLSNALKFLSHCVFAATIAAAGCADVDHVTDYEEEGVEDALEDKGLGVNNGLRVGNGLMSANGLTVANGLSVANGIVLSNGLFVSTGLGLSSNKGLKTLLGIPSSTSMPALTSTSGILTSTRLLKDTDTKQLATYIGRCALASGTTITVNGFTLRGEIGLATAWQTSTCDTACEEWVSACLMALTNQSGATAFLTLSGPATTLGRDTSAGYPYQETVAYGNLFSSPPNGYLAASSDQNKIGQAFNRSTISIPNSSWKASPYKFTGWADAASAREATYTFNGTSYSFPNNRCSATDGRKSAYGTKKPLFNQCTGGGRTYTRVISIWRNLNPT